MHTPLLTIRSTVIFAAQHTHNISPRLVLSATHTHTQFLFNIIFPQNQATRTCRNISPRFLFAHDCDNNISILYYACWKYANRIRTKAYHHFLLDASMHSPFELTLRLSYIQLKIARCGVVISHCGDCSGNLKEHLMYMCGDSF